MLQHFPKHLLFHLLMILGSLSWLNAQNLSTVPADFMQKFVDELALMPLDEQQAIQGRVAELKSQGFTDLAALDALVQEGLIDEALRTKVLAVAEEVSAEEPAAEVDTVFIPEETSLDDRKETSVLEEKPKMAPGSRTPSRKAPAIRPASQPTPKPASQPKPNRVNIYGMSVFDDTTYNQNLSLAPSDDYIIGPGDIFNVTVWNCSELSESLKVSGDGSVKRDVLGKIYVEGLTYAKAREVLRRKYRTMVSSCSNIEIFIGQSRRYVTVNIVGEVIRPGSYKFNAAVPAFNALFEAGGVTNIGSVRNIQIKRNNRVIQVLDIYEYLLEGQQNPIFLQDNDFIYVPIQEKIVGLNGAVMRSSYFEMREEEGLEDLIAFSGGLRNAARRDLAQVRRREGDRYVLKDFKLSDYLDTGLEFPLFREDQVTITRIPEEVKNIVSIKGSVFYPDTYQLQPGERVSDLITRAGGLRDEAHKKQASLVRTIPETKEVIYIALNLEQVMGSVNEVDNPVLQYQDVLEIYNESDFLERRVVKIVGEVRRPGMFLLSPTMTLKDLLYKVGGPTMDADLNIVELSVKKNVEDVDQDRLISGSEGEVDENALPSNDPNAAANPMEEVPELGDENHLIRRIRISENWQDDPTIDTFRIFQFNFIKIYSKYDFIFTRNISIQGAVKNPTTVPLQRDMNLKDLLYFAGGLTQDADVNEIELYRYIDISEKGKYGTLTPEHEIQRVRIEEDWQNGPATDSILMANYYKVVVRSERDFVEEASVKIQGLVNRPGEFQLVPNMTLLDLFYMAEGLKMQADFENIELSRIVEVTNEQGEIVPIPISVRWISTIQDWQKDSSLFDIKLNAYDQVFVRKNPEFKLQEKVTIYGEVETPGIYHKLHKDERLSSLVGRANGATELAYLEGAKLYRRNIPQPVTIKLHKALRNRGGKYDIPLLEGDSLFVPALVNAVTVDGNVLQPGTTVLFERDRQNFKYYVKLAGGFARRSLRRDCTVTYVEGTMKRTRRFLWIKFYPKVEQGALITVASKPEKVKKDRTANGGRRLPRINIEEVLASMTAITTFILLFEQILQR